MINSSLNYKSKKAKITRACHQLKLTGFCRWNRKGVWEKVFEVLSSDADNEYAMIDSTIVRAHHHSAGAKRGIKRYLFGGYRHLAIWMTRPKIKINLLV